ncbi:hypothetical protein RI129_009563 [Pyrocoelia pectoralis]|uniref:Uncharacterized protein n=1 Tax=Pyrocoelia pectoralis TaxID=417401 RepID=A0AAN7ZI50_9COLE
MRKGPSIAYRARRLAPDEQYISTYDPTWKSTSMKQNTPSMIMNEYQTFQRFIDDTCHQDHNLAQPQTLIKTPVIRSKKLANPNNEKEETKTLTTTLMQKSLQANKIQAT